MNISLVARLIGIGKYNHYPRLHAKGDINADKLQKFLDTEFPVGRDPDIRSIKDAAKDTIVTELSSLRTTYDRSKAILVFFSGIGGRTQAGDASVICPATFEASNSSTGITDQELVQLFDSISRARGNNIVSNAIHHS